MGWPEKDEPCVCKGGKIECSDECREKDWDGAIDEDGNMVERPASTSEARIEGIIERIRDVWSERLSDPKEDRTRFLRNIPIMNFNRELPWKRTEK